MQEIRACLFLVLWLPYSLYPFPFRVFALSCFRALQCRAFQFRPWLLLARRIDLEVLLHQLPRLSPVGIDGGT
jgi:hypothetical protein